MSDIQPGGRVMVFVHDLRASGVVRNALAIAGRIAKRHEVSLVVRHDDGFLADAAHQSNRWQVHALFGRATRGGIAAAAWRLRRVIAEERPDVLLSAGNRGHWVVRLATLRRDRPLRLYRISNSIDRHGRGRPDIRGLGLRLLAADAERLIVVGGETARAAAVRGALARGRAEIIPNGVDVARARALARGPSPSAWLEGPLPLVMAVGRLAPQKDFPTLIRAAGRANRLQPLRLVIVGGGTHEEADGLLSLARSEGLEDRFLLAGETGNVFAWLAQAALFVLPSRWEGSSMALLEALALDVPTVATRQAGDAADVLGEGRFGLLVDAGDVDAMAQAILHQLSSEAVRPAGRARAFDAGRTLDLYARVVDRAVARAIARGMRSNPLAVEAGRC